MSADTRGGPALAARVLSFLDLTSLGEQDTPEKIEALCASARTPHGFPAAVCVYPEHVTTARRCLAGAPVRIATVVNFPDGSSNRPRVERETRRAVAAGADEIDLVMPYASVLRDEANVAADVVRACRAACGNDVVLKTIIESGELRSPERIREASTLCIEGGADFIKTSTGKVSVNATPEAADVMLQALSRSGRRCGLKVAGGIRTLADAMVYVDLAEKHMGRDWVVPSHFRIGASTLLGELVAILSGDA